MQRPAPECERLYAAIKASQTHSDTARIRPYARWRADIWTAMSTHMHVRQRPYARSNQFNFNWSLINVKRKKSAAVIQTISAIFARHIINNSYTQKSLMETLEKLFAEKLLKVKAIKLQPANPFTWASGWKSPIYCDNRKTLSYPSLRNFVKIEISRLILEKFGQVDAIAGVATGAIPQGALVADELNLPFVYVRSKPKDHGLENLIEGELRPGMKVVVIEDLVSTGGSSLKAVEALRNNGCEVIGMVASFTYGFQVAVDAFKAAKVELVTLTNYEAVLKTALETAYIAEEDVEVLQAWRKDPANWNVK